MEGRRERGGEREREREREREMYNVHEWRESMRVIDGREPR